MSVIQIRNPNDIELCPRCGRQVYWVTTQRTGKRHMVNVYCERGTFEPRCYTRDYHSKTCAGRKAAREATMVARAIPPELEKLLPTADDIRLALAVPTIIASIMVLITTPDIRSYLIGHDPMALGQVERALRAGGVIPPDTIPVDEQPQVQAEPPMPVEDPAPGPGTVEGPDLLEDDPGNFDAAAALDEIERATKTGRYKEPQ